MCRQRLSDLPFSRLPRTSWEQSFLVGLLRTWLLLDLLRPSTGGLLEVAVVQGRGDKVIGSEAGPGCPTWGMSVCQRRLSNLPFSRRPRNSWSFLIGLLRTRHLLDLLLPQTFCQRLLHDDPFALLLPNPVYGLSGLGLC